MNISLGNYFTNFCVFVICVIVCIQNMLVSATDNFALMSASLRTFQVHACDGDSLNIECHPSTVISISHAQYGRSSNFELCQNSGYRRRPFGRRRRDPDAPCMSTGALKVIADKCQEQISCRLLVDPKTFWHDPCPGQPKFAEVAYKCRPVDFLNLIACEGSKMNMSCSDSLRILVYSAAFGSGESPAQECPQSGKTTEVCYSSYASERVVNMCVGKQSCSFDVDSQSLGDPKCSQFVSKHLKVLYKCVPESVIKSSLTSVTDDNGLDVRIEDTTKDDIQIDTTSYPAWAGNIDHWVPSHFLPDPTPRSTPDMKLEMQRDYVSSTETSALDDNDRDLVSFISEWISAEQYIAGNKDKLILYLSVTLTVGILLFFAVVLVHLFVFRNLKKKQTEKVESPQIADDDFFSDSDLEHFEDDPLKMINSLPRKISETVPRAPISDSPDTNHYFS